MNRATVVYILVLVFCVAGLWVILRVGSGLRAPADLTGVWDIQPAEGRAGDGLGRTMTIDQSGRYAEVRFDTGKVLAMKLADAEPAQTPDASSFAGDGWTLESTVKHGPDGRLMSATLRGPESHSFTARFRNGRPGGGPAPAGHSPH